MATRQVIVNTGIAPGKNALGQATNQFSFGWLGPVLSKMATRRNWVVPLSAYTRVIVGGNAPIEMVHNTPNALLMACRIAVQGSGIKNVLADTMASPPVDITLDLTNKSFGVKFRIVNSPVNMKGGVYSVTLLDGATALAQVYVEASRPPIDVVMLGINNISGRASVIPIADPQVTFTVSGSAFGAGDVVVAETLNARDIGVIG